MIRTIYNVASGEIVMVANMGDQQLTANLQEGQAFLNKESDPAKHIIKSGRRYLRKVGFCPCQYARLVRADELNQHEYKAFTHSPLTRHFRRKWRNYIKQLRDLPEAVKGCKTQNEVDQCVIQIKQDLGLL